MVLQRTTIETPCGPLLALAADDGLRALEFTSPDRVHRLATRLSRWLPATAVQEGTAPVFDTVRGWLDAYFTKRWNDLPALPLVLHGTDFERRVWAVLQDLAPGRVTSYGALALRLGSPRGARAVGAAVGANPVAIVVPCHRVIGATGSLTGYGGGLERKRWLLTHEGAISEQALPKSRPSSRGSQASLFSDRD